MFGGDMKNGNGNKNNTMYANFTALEFPNVDLIVV